jgi:hypothetical protein
LSAVTDAAVDERETEFLERHLRGRAERHLIAAEEQVGAGGPKGCILAEHMSLPGAGCFQRQGSDGKLHWWCGYPGV